MALVKYTTREEHPLPAIIMHWIHLIALAFLIFTGFYIRHPFFPGGMGPARMWHFVMMFVFILTAVVRVYWAFLGQGSASHATRRKVPDYRYFGPEPKANKGAFLGTLKYYLFLSDVRPGQGKYNPLQKITYVFWLVLIILQAITGFCLFTPTMGAFMGLTYLLGGLAAVRTIHYLIMWLFIVTVALHIYLAIAGEPLLTPLMFWWQEKPEPAKRQGA